MLAGLVTGILHTFCGIPAILAGILTQLGLWSVNMAVMGMKATVAINVTSPELLDKLLVSLRFVQDVAKGARPFYRHPIFTVGLATVAIIAFCTGFSARSWAAPFGPPAPTAAWPALRASTPTWPRFWGWCFPTALWPCPGALLAQYNSASEINMGRGAIVIGLAAVIIGEVAFSRVFHNFALKLLSVSIGAIIYYIVIQACLAMGMNPNYLKLLSAIVVAVFLSIPFWKGKYFHAKVKSRAAGAEAKLGGERNA